MAEPEENGGLIARARGDDLVVPVLMRRSSFEALTARSDGHSVPVSEGMIGLVPTRASNGDPVYTFVVWSGEPVWHGVPEQIPGNQLAADALQAEREEEP